MASSLKPLGDQSSPCFTPRMITGLCSFLGAVIGTALMLRRQHRAAARADAGQAVLFPIGAKRPDASRRWNLGRTRANAEEFRWEPRWPWTRLRELPADLRFVRARHQTGREWLWLPTGALVIECESSDGPIWLWVMHMQVEHVVPMIRCD